MLFRALIVSLGYLWDNNIDHTISCPGGEGGGGVLGLTFAGYVPLASQSPYSIIVYFLANYNPVLVTFWKM